MILAVCASTVVFPASALAAETIHDFAVTATVSPNRTTTFVEAVTYDFGYNERHGIYRIIPVTYSRNGGTYRLRLDVQNVTRDDQSEEYVESTESGRLKIKIGSADKTISGAHAYEIAYQTDRAINFFPDHDELYWNVTGNEWEAPIEKASFLLRLPEGVSFSSVSSTCFTGPFGSTESSCAITQGKSGELRVTSLRVLEYGEGMTVVVGFPKGIIIAPTAADSLWQILRDNGVLFFPLAAFIIMFMMWWQRGRDPELGTVIPEFEAPEKLSPALTGAIMTNGDVPSHTITATIIDLARRGYLKIRFEEKKGILGFGSSQTYTFVKQKEIDDKTTEYEQALFSGLFSDGEQEVAVEDLKDKKFYLDVATFRKHVQAEVDRKHVFVANPTAVRGAYITVGVFLTWGMFFFFGSSGLGVLSALLSGFFIIIFGIFMPKRTARGVKLLAGIKGFKWFLSVTEKDRLDFHNAPERTPEQFMALLPYAIAFEVEQKWAAQFASLDLPAPAWAEGSGMSHFNAMYLVSSLDSMHSAAASSGYAAPSSAGSGGSGFSGGGSGGGFGGGGGGSW